MKFVESSDTEAHGMRTKIRFSSFAVLIVGIISLGIFLRLLFAFSFNHVFDSFNILAIAKSEGVTGSALDAYLAIRENSKHETQLFGKLYYQMIGGYMRLLDAVKLLNFAELFNGPSGYLSGLGVRGPAHHELFFIKTFQFIFDGVFLLFFMLAIRLLHKDNEKRMMVAGALFWAINPYMIYPSYVPFQSDIPMVACLMAGIYIGLKARLTTNTRIHLLLLGLMSIFFALGAIIKQVPLLFIIPLLLLVSKSMKSGLVGMGVFGVSYQLFSQPWSADAHLYKSLFLLSPESIALLKFNLNSASVFLVLYGIFTAGVLRFLPTLRSSHKNILTVVVLLFAIIYLSEDVNYLYAQFNSWIMPFLFLLMLQNRSFAVFMLAPVIGFYRWIVIDNGATTGSLWITFGKPLADIPSTDVILKQLASPFLVHTGINSLLIFGYVLLVIIILRPHVAIIPPKGMKIALVPISLFVIYVSYFFVDYRYKANHVRLTDFGYLNTQEEKLSERPIEFQVSNPSKERITALDIPIRRASLGRIDQTIVTVYDENGDVLSKGRVQDLSLPPEFEDFYIHLDQPVSAGTFRMTIAKEFGFNDVFIKTAGSQGSPPDLEQSYMHYDAFYRDNMLKMEFEGKVPVIQLRGSYGINHMIENVQFHARRHPTAYVLIAGMMMISFLGTLPMAWNRGAILRKYL